MDPFVALFIILLAIFIGYLISSKIPTIFQTSLLSGASFINGVVLIGAMLILGNSDTTVQTIIGFIAVTLAAANAIGGYIVTSRLLKLFKKNNEVGGE